MTEELVKTVGRRSKRLGRGYGSGKGGHTVGRGQKGQKTRAKIGVIFEGIKMKKSFIKKLPLQRGRGKFGPQDKPIIVKLGYLNLLPSGAKVDLNTLVKEGIVDRAEAEAVGIKILGDGKLGKKLTIEVPISKNAAKAVVKAGGKVV
jgi:large subunit ribosomal protein L15